MLGDNSITLNETYRATCIRTQASPAVDLSGFLEWLNWHWRITQGKVFSVTLLGEYWPSHMGPLDDPGSELHLVVHNEPVELVMRSWAERGTSTLFLEATWTGPGRAESQFGEEPELEVAIMLGEVIQVVTAYIGREDTDRLAG